MSVSGQDEDAVQDINEGYVELYNHVLTLNTKGPENEKVPIEYVFKILVRQTDDVLESVRFQLSNNKDLDFLYESTYSEEEFNEMKQEQDLEIQFADFPNVIRQLINTCVKQDESDVEAKEKQFKVSLKDKDPESQEDDQDEHNEEESSPETRYFLISQRLDFTSVIIFNLIFKRCEENRVERISQHRYDDLSKKLQAASTEYKDMLKRLQRQAPKILQGFKPNETQQK